MAIDPRDLLRIRAPQSAEPPLAGTRAERIQRLQIGLFGVCALALMVGLAGAITNRAQETEDNSVPEAAPTVIASETNAPSDPLADAGVVPELSAETEQETPVDLSDQAPEADEDVPPPEQ